MTIEDRIEIFVLAKYYGSMLTSKQMQVIRMYVDNNLSLQEVANELDISRQAVKDSLDTAVATLKNYEEMLGFIARDHRIATAIEKIPQKDLNNATKKYIIDLIEEE